ncbi:MAG: DUF2141 domain-containing protein [Bacteroidales bacterium]|nr:DUF2141 domain-containing protein [Bacteroidales bacterium]
MKSILFFAAVFFLSWNCLAQQTFKLEIKGVKKHGGTVYVSLFNTEKSYKNKEVFLSKKIDASNETLYMQMQLPRGEYFFSVFQDNNGNGKLDTNLVGIPKELVGLSNYDGKNIPGNFNRHKVLVNETTKLVTVHLYQI